MDGEWMDGGWMEGIKAVLRIAYSNHTAIKKF